MVITIPKIAVIVGSHRQASINLKLAHALTKLISDRAEFVWIDIAGLPFYDLDLEPNRPQVVNTFTSSIQSCNGVLFVSPEYNRSLPAIVKNAIDWGSKPLASNVWRNKPVAITGTSPGAIGTALMQQHLRQILGVLGALVLGGEAYIMFKENLISNDFTISNFDTKQFLKTYMDSFLALLSRF